LRLHNIYVPSSSFEVYLSMFKTTGYINSWSVAARTSPSGMAASGVATSWIEASNSTSWECENLSQIWCSWIECSTWS
jgi:hypothetical protein